MAASQSYSRSRSRPDVLRASVTDVSTLASLLRPIAFTTVARFSVHEAGIQVTTQSERSVQSIAYISSSIFDEFDFDLDASASQLRHAEALSSQLDPPPPSLELELDIGKLLECLNVFGGAPPGSSFTNGKSRGEDRPGLTNGGEARFGDRGSGGPTRPQGFPREDNRATSMKLRWRGPGNPVVLLLEEQDVTTRCELATFEPIDLPDFAFSQEDMQAQAILKSSFLLDALSTIDAASCKKVILFFSNRYIPSLAGPHSRKSRRTSTGALPLTQGTTTSMSSSSSTTSGGASHLGAQPMFKISSDGDFGTTSTEIPNSLSVLEKFTCATETANAYRYAHFARVLKGLQYSVKASLRVDSRGLLSVQLMMPRGSGVEVGAVRGGGGNKAGAAAAGDTPTKRGHGFLEFLIAPLDEDLSADEDNEAEADQDPQGRRGGNESDEGVSRGEVTDEEGDSGDEAVSLTADETTLLRGKGGAASVGSRNGKRAADWSGSEEG